MADAPAQPRPQHPTAKRWFRESTLFALLICVSLVPIWAFRYVPTQDGPAHLYNAWLLTQHGNGSNLWDYFEINTKLSPNWLGHLVLAALMQAFSPLTSEKILLSGYVILLPLAMRYAVRSVRPNAGFVAILVLPLVYNFMFHLGFYNFLISSSIMLLAVGFWIRHQDQFGFRHAIGFFVLMLVMFFFHVLPVAVACMAIACMGGWMTLIDLRAVQTGRLTKRKAWEYFRSRGVLPLIAALPAVLLTMKFLLNKTPVVRAGGEPPAVSPLAGFYAQEGITSIPWLMRRFASFQIVEGWLWLAFIAMFAVVVVVLLRGRLRTRAPMRWDGLLAATLVMVAGHLSTPRASWGENIFLRNRIELLFAFLAIVWFSSQVWGVRLQRAVQAVSTLLVLAMVAVHVDSYRLYNHGLAEYTSAGAKIEPGTSVVSFCFTRSATHDPPAGRASWGLVNPFLHASSYISLENRLVDLENYEARTDYFPIRFRDHQNPARAENLRKGLPASRFILTWCQPAEGPCVPDDSTLPLLTDVIASDFTKEFTSTGGRARVYRARD